MGDVELVVAAETQNEARVREILGEKPRLVDGQGYVRYTFDFFFRC
jgi:hypothetical protein